MNSAGSFRPFVHVREQEYIEIFVVDPPEKEITIFRFATPPMDCVRLLDVQTKSNKHELLTEDCVAFLDVQDIPNTFYLLLEDRVALCDAPNEF